MYKKILFLFITLNIVLIGGWLIGDMVLPIRTETFLGQNMARGVSENPLIWSRANFDGVHYTKIAREGYQHLQQAFFPLYPLLIRLLDNIFGNNIFSGIMISSISYLGFIYLLTKLLKEIGEDKKTIEKTIVYYSIFPTSFYLLSVYNESFFLLIIIASFYLAHKKKWLLAGLVGGVASATRLIGFFLVPALIYQYYQSENKREMVKRLKAVKQGFNKRFSWKYVIYLMKTRLLHIKHLLGILTALSGVVAYSIYLQITTGDFFYFVSVQPDFLGGRQVDRLVMIYQVFWRYLKMIFTVDVISHTYGIVWFELLVTVLFAFLLIYTWLKTKIPRSWLIFSLFAYLLPTFTGTFSSMPRYVLACFPCFLGLAKLKLPRYVYWISFGLLFLSATLFVRGYWIA